MDGWKYTSRDKRKAEAARDIWEKPLLEYGGFAKGEVRSTPSNSSESGKAFENKIVTSSGDVIRVREEVDFDNKVRTIHKVEKE